MSRLGTTEKPENCNGLDLTSCNGTFVQRIVVTAMQAVEGVPTGFAISILKRATKVRHRAGVWPNGKPKPQT
jgi:hypothetical protein